MPSAVRVPAALPVLVLLGCGGPDPAQPTTPTAALRASTIYTVQALPLPGRTLEGEARGINDAGFMARPDPTSGALLPVVWRNDQCD